MSNLNASGIYNFYIEASKILAIHAIRPVCNFLEIICTPEIAKMLVSEENKRRERIDSAMLSEKFGNFTKPFDTALMYQFVHLIPDPNEGLIIRYNWDYYKDTPEDKRPNLNIEIKTNHFYLDGKI